MSSTPSRRRFMQAMPALGALFGLSAAAQAAEPVKPVAAAAPVKKERFPGDPPEHHIVYQINHAEWEYIEHILNSISAMLTKYEDNVGDCCGGLWCRHSPAGQKSQARYSRAFAPARQGAGQRLWCEIHRLRQHHENRRLGEKRHGRFRPSRRSRRGSDYGTTRKRLRLPCMVIEQ